MCFNNDPAPRVNEALEKLFTLSVEKQHEVLRELFSINYSDDLEGDLDWAITETSK